eukprot:SAG11_NODE_16623_length_542_cov_0.934537_1_plen_57_part_10
MTRVRGVFVGVSVGVDCDRTPNSGALDRAIAPQLQAAFHQPVLSALVVALGDGSVRV